MSDDGRAQTTPFDPQPYPILSVDTGSGEITVLAVTNGEDDSAITSTPTGLEWAVRGPLGKPVTIDPSQGMSRSSRREVALGRSLP